MGLTIGMTRTVIPGLAVADFGLAEKQFFLLSSFVVSFGIVKALMNLIAGSIANRFGRKKILIWGWIASLPIPLIIYHSNDWNWIVFSTVLLGINQGLCWSMTINSKLDLALPTQRGTVNGINEFSGYVALAIAGLLTAYLSDIIGPRESILYFGMSVVVLGLISSITLIKETLPWASIPTKSTISFKDAFSIASWKNKQLFAVNQAGLIEKFVDSLVWIFMPIFILSQGYSLLEASSVISVFAITWGASQLITGPLSDKIGRKPLIFYGLLICATTVLIVPFLSSLFHWSIDLFIMGIGMAMLYPSLGASVSDLTTPEQRPVMLGIYRFWRDLGYAISALIMGFISQYSDSLTTPFFASAFILFVSALITQYYLNNK